MLYIDTIMQSQTNPNHHMNQEPSPQETDNTPAAESLKHY